jgi:hypothetical protein
MDASMKFKHTCLHLAAAAWLALSSAQANATTFAFEQSGYQGGGLVSGTFDGADLNGDGFISFFDDGEVSNLLLNFNGTDLIGSFSHTTADVAGLVWNVSSPTLGDSAMADGLTLEGMATNWVPDEFAAAGLAPQGYSFATGMGPLGDMRGEVTDWATGARLTTTEAMRISPAAVPEPGTWGLMGLGLLGVSLLRARRQDR